MSDQEESDIKEDEPETSKKKSEQKSDCTTKECKNGEKCKNCSDCKHKKDTADCQGPAPAEFIEDLERKWSTDDEIDYLEEMMDRKERNPRKIFNSLKKKIFNFR